MYRWMDELEAAKGNRNAPRSEPGITRNVASYLFVRLTSSVQVLIPHTDSISYMLAYRYFAIVSNLQSLHVLPAPG
jgi:hypothetical protein